MRRITAVELTGVVRELAMEAAIRLEPDILEALRRAAGQEEGLPRSVIELLLANADIAGRERIPVCQDTGISVVFVELGQQVMIDGDFEAAIQEGVRQGYLDGYLRKSVCDPITRKNTGTNTPAVIHTEIVAGDRVKISFLPKGCGSENMSGLVLLPPSSGMEGVVRYVADKVVAAGPNPCPPVIVGVGVGGSFEKAALLAKRALLRPVGTPSARADVAAFEARMLAAINEQGGGALGFGGRTTALAVHMEVFPSHIASLPVAVNIQCHAHRHKERTI